MSGECGSYYIYDGCGVVFEVSAPGKFSVLHTFDFSDGANPIISAQDSDGNLYGTTVVWGGDTACTNSGGCGVIFRLTTAAISRSCTVSPAGQMERILMEWSGIAKGNFSRHHGWRRHWLWTSIRVNRLW